VVPVEPSPPDRSSARSTRDVDVSAIELVTSSGDAALLWIGADDRGVESEIVAAVLPDLFLVIFESRTPMSPTAAAGRPGGGDHERPQFAGGDEALRLDASAVLDRVMKFASAMNAVNSISGRPRSVSSRADRSCQATPTGSAASPNILRDVRFTRAP